MKKKRKLKKQYKILLLVIMMTLVLLSTLAASYSLWLVTKEQDNTNLVVSGCFDITYNDLDDDSNSTNISLTNTYPISDDLGKQLAPYRVKIKNNCSIAADYTFSISSLNNNTLDEDYLKVFIKKDSTEYGPLLFPELTSYDLHSSVKNSIETEKSVSIKNSYILATGILNPDDEETYEVRMWVKKEATDVMEKEFGSIITFEAYATDTNQS